MEAGKIALTLERGVFLPPPLVAVALDVVPSPRKEPGVTIVDARGVAAGTQSLDAVEKEVFAAVAVLVTEDPKTILLHSLSDLLLCVGKREALRFVQRLASETRATVVCVVHEALHSDRDLAFWRDLADYEYSTDALGKLKQHSLKKQAVQFKRADLEPLAATAVSEGSSAAVSVVQRSSSGALVTNAEDFEDEDDPDDDLDL